MNVHAEEAAVSQEKVSEWYQRVAVGGNKLIMSLEDSPFKTFELRVPPPSQYRCSLQFQTVVDSVNSARRKKGLPKIRFLFSTL